MLGQQYIRNGDKEIEYREGIFIRVPGRPNVNVVRKRFGSPLAANFQVIRPLVNFCFKDANDKAVTGFKPPLELIVWFTQHDLDEAEKLEKELVFAYYDIGRNVWVPLPPTLANVTRHMLPGDFVSSDGNRGFDAITLDSWPADPAGAWGV